jgi:hypothetical protein
LPAEVELVGHALPSSNRTQSMPVKVILRPVAGMPMNTSLWVAK